MTAPVSHPHACYADGAWFGRALVQDNVRLARDTYRLRVTCPAIAERIVPGQFVMLRLAGIDDPLLGRPFALYDTVLDDADRPVGIDVVYLVLGKLTSRLAAVVPGQDVEIWGPLGNGFMPTPAEHLVMVAGGIGQTPFVALAREALGQKSYRRPAESVGRATLCYGVRSGDYLAGLDDFAATGAAIRLSTDDGSQGHHGLVTELLWQLLSDERERRGCRVVCCGPEPMMATVAELTAKFGVPCEVSLETPMACGIGICFSCVARVRDDHGGWDYRRTCVEGPVFDARKIDFGKG